MELQRLNKKKKPSHKCHKTFSADLELYKQFKQYCKVRHIDMSERFNKYMEDTLNEEGVQTDSKEVQQLRQQLIDVNIEFSEGKKFFEHWTERAESLCRQSEFIANEINKFKKLKR